LIALKTRPARGSENGRRRARIRAVCSGHLPVLAIGFFRETVRGLSVVSCSAPTGYSVRCLKDKIPTKTFTVSRDDSICHRICHPATKQSGIPASGDDTIPLRTFAQLLSPGGAANEGLGDGRSSGRARRSSFGRELSASGGSGVGCGQPVVVRAEQECLGLYLRGYGRAIPVMPVSFSIRRPQTQRENLIPVWKLIAILTPPFCFTICRKPFSHSSTTGFSGTPQLRAYIFRTRRSLRSP
jgi:hypothetical protein